MESLHRLTASTDELQRFTIENANGLINLSAKLDMSDGSLQNLDTVVHSTSSRVSAKLRDLREQRDLMATVQEFLPEEVQTAFTKAIETGIINAYQRRKGLER